MRSLRHRGAVLLAPHLALVALALAAHSESASILGRYSRALFAFNVLSAGALAVAAVATVRGAVRTAAFALLVLFALSFVGATNNTLARSHLGIPLMIVSRVCDALLVLVLAVDAVRDPRTAARGKRVLALGSSLLCFSVVDVAATMILGAVPVARAGGDLPFRRRVDLAKIEREAVAVVGDSFVWGQGVKEGEPFADLLARQLEPLGIPVYNLGIVGGDLSTYLAVLKRVPERDTAIVCYFMNDMPEPETALASAREALVAMGHTSFTARLVADLVGFKTYPSAAAYERAIIESYDKRDPTYPLRSRMVEGLLAQVAAEAKRGARRQPILVIFPLMYEFSKYPLREAHRDLAALGRADGFEVVDMLPIFSEAFPHGADFKVAPNDDHFNAVVHAKVAEVLRGVLARRGVGSP